MSNDGINASLQAPHEASDLVKRSLLQGTEIDFAGDEIRYKTLLANTVFTIVRPVLGRMLLLELDGVFTVTWPATVEVINGDYLPALGVNYAFLLCTDKVTPHYLCSWTTEI